MAKPVNRNDAVAVAQVTKITPVAPEIGDEFRLGINGKYVAFTATAATVASVVAGLVAAWNASQVPEHREVVASSGTDAEGNVTHVLLTARTPGVPFTVTSQTSNSTAGLIVVTETTKGVAPQNEVQRLTIVGSGGTFTLSMDLGSGVETTAALAWNISAAALQAALEALPSIAPGDIVVTGTNPWFVYWQGAPAEKPEFTVDGALLTGNGSVTVETIQDGAGFSDEIQLIGFTGASSGTYRLRFNGQTTGTLNKTNTPAAVQAALEALSTIAAGNVAVYGIASSDVSNQNDGYYFVHFQGALAGVNVTTLELLNNTEGQIYVLQEGGQTTANEFQFLDFGNATGGLFSLTLIGETTATIDMGSFGTLALSTQIKQALEALPGVGSGNVRVNGPAPSYFADALPCVLVEFLGGKANTDIGTIEINGADLTGGTGVVSTTVVHQGNAVRNEIQHVRIFGSGGSFTLTLDGQTTGAIAYGAAAATVKTALEALSNVTAVNVTGTGTPEDAYVVEFADPGGENLPPMTGNGAALTGGDGQCVEITAHVVGVSEVQTITKEAGVVGGTFRLRFRGEQTGPIAHDASAVMIEAALEALTTIGAAGVSVTGAGPWIVTFTGALADQDVELLAADGSGLDGGPGSQSLQIVEVTRSRGPNHWDDPANWTTGRVPESGDDLTLEAGNVDFLHGLRQLVEVTADPATDTLTMSDLAEWTEGQQVRITSDGTLPGGLSVETSYYVRNLDRDGRTLQLAATEGGAAVDITSAGTGIHTLGVRLASFTHQSRYTGKIGLPQRNTAGYWEYRPLYLSIGLLSTGEKRVVIGNGQGGSSGRIRLDHGPDQVAWEVLATGGVVESGVPPLLLKSQHSGSTLEALGGDLGVAYLAGETAKLHTIRQRAGSVRLGKVTDLALLDKTGGTFFADEATVAGAVKLRG